VSCAACHEEEDRFWRTTPHAHAYATLARDNKEFNLDCVSCHVTGYEKPGGSTVTHVSKLKDVGCEVCHGPGTLHASEPKRRDLIRRTPERSLCASECHHPPHVNPGWDVEGAWAKIVGPGHGAP
jgi:Cytochrome c554 and c-prime